MRANYILVSTNIESNRKSRNNLKIIISPVHSLLDTYLPILLFKEENKRLKEERKTKELEVCIAVFLIDNKIW